MLQRGHGPLQDCVPSACSRAGASMRPLKGQMLQVIVSGHLASDAMVYLSCFHDNRHRQYRSEYYYFLISQLYSNRSSGRPGWTQGPEKLSNFESLKVSREVC